MSMFIRLIYTNCNLQSINPGNLRRQQSLFLHYLFQLTSGIQRHQENCSDSTVSSFKGFHIINVICLINVLQLFLTLRTSEWHTADLTTGITSWFSKSLFISYTHMKPLLRYSRTRFRIRSVFSIRIYTARETCSYHY